MSGRPKRERVLSESEFEQLKALTTRRETAIGVAVASAHRAGLAEAMDNKAVAAKLRQLAPRLLLHFKEREKEVTGIRVEVQVKPHKIKAEDDVTGHSLPPDAIKDFSALSEALPASPLKNALDHLVARRRRPKPD